MERLEIVGRKNQYIHMRTTIKEKETINALRGDKSISGFLLWLVKSFKDGSLVLRGRDK